MSTVAHSAAAGIHPGAYVQSGDPGAVGAGILWVNTTGSAPFPIAKRNAGNTGWDAVSAAVFGASGGSHSTGLVPDPGSSAGTSKFLREDASWQTVGATLTSSTAYLGTDVSMSSANTAYDAVSLSLAAGTWLLIGNASVKPGANASQITAKLWDGTTNVSSAETVIAASANSQSVAVQAIVSPGSTTTYKLTCYAADAGATIKAALVSNPAGNTATYLLAVKIA